jgi:lipoate-protein ligase A
MAIDQALLREAVAGNAFLRLYRWDPPCLSFGRNEPAATRYDTDRIRALGLDTVRRPTGGRAVWHDAEVTYAVAAPVATFGSLRETYVAIHTMIARSLARLGVTATLADRPCHGQPGVGVGACFASPAGGEVIVRGRKLVGSAQVREGNAFLQHGSILLGNGQDVVSAVTRGDAPTASATSLEDVLGRSVTFAEVTNAIVQEAGASWPVHWHSGGWPAPPVNTVPLCGQSAFVNPAWTWRR